MDLGRRGPASLVAALLEDDGPAIMLTHAARRLGAVHVPLNRRAAVPELVAQLQAVSRGTARPR